MKKSLLVLCLVLAGLSLFSWLLIGTLKISGYREAASSERRPYLDGSGPSQAAAPSEREPYRSNTQPTGLVPGGAGGSGLAVAPTNQVGGAPIAAAGATPQRPWDPAFFDHLHDASPGQAIGFELVGARAEGVIQHMNRANGEVIYVSGELTAPEAGRFFFQKQTGPGKAGEYAGVVEFPASKIGYRVEPSGQNGTSVLVRLPLEQIVCMAMPAADFSKMEPEEIPPLKPESFPDYPIPDYQDGIIPLQSLPGSTAVLYIDFRGGYTPTWGGITYERPSVSNAQIRDVWKRVAEDYMPFNINVTTDIKVYESAPETTRQRCICTPTTTAAPGAGGVAYLNSWNWTGDTPCWSFYSSGKSAAEVVSHEVGHTLQLGHDGRTSPSEGYYGGHGSGAVGWAPIMGVGYYQPVVQWSKGEYLSANNTEDDLVKIVSNNNNVDYRLDDTGPNLATSRYLEVYSNNTAFAEGVIGTTGDTDAFQFTTTGGVVALRASPVGDWANLAVSVTLCNSSDVVIYSNNPQTTLYAVISASVPAGTYTFKVTGVGRNDPLSTGFSAYDSMGYYSISGTVANARQSDRFSIPENSPYGTIVGVIPANNPEGGPLSYVITGGNSNNTFSVDNLGQLRVVNPSALNYEVLGANTQFPVQYELFVNINNLTNPALTEIKRRVVVSVTDVNEAPVTGNLSLSVLEHTLPGTYLGTVSGTDPDFYNLLSFAIVSGDTNGVFSIGSQSGELRVAGDLDRAVQPTYQLRVAVSDNIGPFPMVSTSVVVVAVLPNTTPFQPGGINYAIYDNISGNILSGLTSSPNFPNNPASEKLMSSLEGDTDRGDNYGSVMRGYLIPPASGAYTFYIASDDNSELRLSTSTNPASASVIAYVSGSGSWTGPREWTKYSTQRSAARSLVAGQAYYIEARQKEGTGGDNLAVGWTGPGISTTTVIGGAYLAPYTMNYIPRVTGFTGEVRRDAFPGFRVGRIAVADANQGDSHQFAIISGNFEGIFGVDADGWIIVADAQALTNTGVPTFVISVSVTDSGVPSLSANADAIISIAEPGRVPVAVRREMFMDIGSSTAVSGLTTSAKYPGKVDQLVTLTDFSTATDVADNYGSRVRALLVPPTTGAYRFYIASDDASQLKISTTTNPASAVVIASVNGYSSPGVYDKEAGQISGYRSLVAGQKYYIEALQKEGGGGDHLSVAWTMPGTTTTNVISGAYLEGVDLGYAPLFASQTLGVFESAVNGVVIGTVAASDSPLDTLTYQIISGNTNNTFAINPATGDVLLQDNSLIADGSVSSFNLVIAAQDSGCGGLYPLRTAQALVAINVVSSNSPLVWLGASGTNRWSEPGNWGGVLPYDGAGLIFGAPLQQANVNDVLSQVAWVRLTNSGFQITGNPLSIQSGLTNSGANTWDIDTTLAGGQYWNISGGTLTVDGAVDTAGFNLNLVAASDVKLGGSISGTGGVSKSGAGRLLLAGSHTLVGILTVASTGGTGTALEVNGAGDLDLSGCDLVMNGRMDLWNRNATIGSLNGNGLIFANDSSRRLIVGANNHSGFFSGSLTNSTWSASATLGLLKTGTGTQTLTGSSYYSAGTIIRAGQLAPANANALGTGTVTLGDSETGTNSVTLAASAAVIINNSLEVPAGPSGSVTIGTANMNPGSVNMQFGGSVMLSRDVTLQAGSSDRTTFAGKISGSGGLNIISPFAPNRRLLLDRASGLSNDFTGDVIVGTNAVLQLGNNFNMSNRAIPDGAVIGFDPGSQLRFGPQTAGDFETVGALVSRDGISGSVDMATGNAFTLGFGARDGWFSGPIQNTVGSLALRKTGVGTQVLDGNNTFGGLTTISGGTLVAGSATALGSTSAGTIVGPDATLVLSNNITIASEVLSLSGSGFGNSGALQNASGDNTYNGAVLLAGPAKVRSQAGNLTLGSVNLGANLLTLEALENTALAISGAISGVGGVEKTGLGPVTLMGENLHSGPTVVLEGAMVLGSDASISNSSVITVESLLDVSALTNGWVVAAGQTLQGNGAVTGTVMVAGTVSPGMSVGKLTLQGDVVLGGTAVMEISRNGSVLTNDLLMSTASVTPGGVLVVTNIGPDAPVPGDSWKLLDAATFAVGNFTTLVLPQVSGIAWDTSRLATEGIITALLGEPAEPPSLSLSSSNGNLTISWPNDYTSYTLEAQTNTPGEGITPTWYPVPGVISNTFTFPIDNAAGSVFYRLIKP